MEGSRKINIHAPGMEGPGKGELVHLGWEAVGGKSEYLGGEQGLCEFLVSGFLVLCLSLATVSRFKQVGFCVMGSNHQLRWIFCYWKLLSASGGSIPLQHLDLVLQASRPGEHTPVIIYSV